MIGWTDFVGNERVVASLRRAVQARSPHHAYLLLGPEGTGRLTLARMVAAGLVCDSEGERPCRECPSCRKVEAGTHTDVWIEAPQEPSHAILVEQVAEIQRRLSFRRSGPGFRVVLLDEAGSMNAQAQNKLLKTLEEPPPGTVLMLCALHPGQMLVTVRSRCQKLSLAPVDPAALGAWLQERHGADPEAAAAAATASHGRPGLATTLMDPEARQVRAKRLVDLSCAMAGDRSAIDRLAEEVDREKEGCLDLLCLLQELLRDAIVDALQRPVPLLHPDAPRRSGHLADCPAGHLAELQGRVQATRERLSRNVHPGWLLEDLLVHLGTRNSWT